MKISIVTTTYNSGKTIADTLDSVLSQTYKDYEYWVIDGASKDNTMEIVRSYESKFQGKLHYISEADKGIYDAMNKGISKCTGDIVGILNSDDFFTSDNILERVAQTMTDINIDAVYGDVHYVKADNLKKCVRYYSSRLFGRNWMRLGFMPAHPSFYCRKEVYNRYGGFKLNYKVAADFECLLRLIYIEKIHIQYLHLDFVTMRTGGASSSGLRSHRQIMRDHLRALHDNGVRSCAALLSLRYLYKIGEVAISKMCPLKNTAVHNKK